MSMRLEESKLLEIKRILLSEKMLLEESSTLLLEIPRILLSESSTLLLEVDSSLPGQCS